MSISTMQQRRPHSTVAIPEGSGTATTTTREQRRNERRIAKEKRNNYGTTKKYRRVKRTTRSTTNNNNNKLYGIILGKWKNDPYLQITFFTFMLCTIFGISIYRVFHGGSSSNSHAPVKHKPFQANRASNEYNSDNAGGSLLSKLRGELLMLFVFIWFDYCVGYSLCTSYAYFLNCN